jgi:hypothetical protein
MTDTKTPPKDTGAAGFGSIAEPKALDPICQGPGCEVSYKPRRGKRFCSDSCRAKAADQKKIERFRALLDNPGEITEEDVKRFAKVFGSKKARVPKKKPVRLNKSHRDLLEWINKPQRVLATQAKIETGGGGIFCPALHRESPLSWGRRARELRELGLLESFKIGKYTAFRRKS